MAEKLAIFNQLPEIVELIKKNEVTWTIVDTGCGKSIGIPYALLRQGVKVICTQPTIPAATSLFEYQKKLSPKFRIGFAAEGTKMYDAKTQCIYATAGHIRKVMRGYFEDGKARDMTFTTILLVDEIHVGSKDNSIIIDLWKEAKRQGVKVPKLVLATATDFGLSPLMKDLGGVIFRSDFRHFKVEIRYHRRDYFSPDDDQVVEDAARIAIDLLKEKKSHGIVFCSGASEVEDMVYELQTMVERQKLSGNAMFKGKTVKVLAAYSQCKREEIDDAIKNEEESTDEKGMPNGCIKIVVGTNLLESSLTIPNVVFVVDSMVEKRTDIIRGRAHLGTTWVSKNSADQRKGRTGRTINGSVCYRMVSEAGYATYEDFRPLEIRRTPICDVLIELLTIGLDPVKVISELDREKLEAAKKTLVESGCIILNIPKPKEKPKVKSFLDDDEFQYDLRGNKINPKGEMPLEGEAPATVTPVGHFVASMPMDVRNAAALFYYLNGIGKDGKPSTDICKDENLFWPLVAFVIADLYGPPNFFWPRKEKNEKTPSYQARLAEYATKFFSDFKGSNPLESLVIAFKACMDANAKTGLNTSFWKIREWCTKNSCNNKKMREVVMQLKRMQRIVSGMKQGEDTASMKCEYELEKGSTCISKTMPRISMAYERAYQGILLTTAGFSVVGSDGQIVQLDTMKTVSRTAERAVGYIPLSEIQFRDAKGRMLIMVSLWFPIQRRPTVHVQGFNVTVTSWDSTSHYNTKSTSSDDDSN